MSVEGTGPDAGTGSSEDDRLESNDHVLTRNPRQTMNGSQDRVLTLDKPGLFTSGRGLELLPGFVTLAVLYLVSLQSYLLFHTLVELFSIVIGLTLFIIAWNVRRTITDHYILFIGIAYLFVAVLDTFHTLSYKGMGVMAAAGANTATQVWIAARYLQAASLLAAPLFLKRRVNSEATLFFLSVATALILASIYLWDVFPTCYREGVGLTPFKVASEYLISALLLAALILLHRNRAFFDRTVLRWISASIATTIASELAFTFYAGVYDLSNLVGHFLRVAAFYLFYKAVVEMGLRKPYELLFRNLVGQQEALQQEKKRAQGYLDAAGIIVVLNPDQTIALINEAGCQLLGYEEREVVGRNWFDTFIPRAARDEARAAFAGFIAGNPEGIALHEGPLLTRGGQERTIRWHNRPLRDDRGQVSGILSAGQDVTDRVRTEEELLRLHDQLEKRVRERTSLLDLTNQRLTSEIEQRKKAEQGLEEQSRLLEAFFKHSLTPIVFLDRTFNIVRVNEAYAASCQRDASEFIGRNHFEFYPSDTKAIFHWVMETKKAYQAFAEPFTFLDRPDWGASYWDWTLVPILDDAGEVDFLVYALNDVTERKLAEEEVRKHAQLLDLANDTIIVCTIEGDVTYWNRGAEQLYGWSKEEAIGRNIHAFLQTEPAERIDDVQVAFFRDGYWEGEIVHSRKDGTKVTVLSRWTLQRDQDNLPVAFSEINRDITELKRKEKELRDSSRYSRSLIEASLDSLVTIDANGKIMDVSRATELVTGVDRQQLIGSDFSDYFTDPQRAREGYRAAFSEGFVRDYPLAIRHVSGRTTEVLYNANVYRDETGSVQGVFAAARDVTELRAAQRALQRSHDELERHVEERTAELEAANRELESFSYSVSHDLQTPLRAIDGYSRMILRDHGDLCDEKARQKFATIRMNAQMMGQLINDLLAFSRLGRKELTLSRLDMQGLIDDAWKELQVVHPERKLDLNVRAMPSAFGDRTLIKQVLVNLLSNAIKFTKYRDCAKIEAGGYADGHQATYYVIDNGVGFDMAYHDKMFGVFQRLHDHGEFEGTGVGLAIVQRIIHRHGGRVWAEGKPDQGASFYFSLKQ